MFTILVAAMVWEVAVAVALCEVIKAIVLRDDTEDDA